MHTTRGGRLRGAALVLVALCMLSTACSSEAPQEAVLRSAESPLRPTTTLLPDDPEGGPGREAASLNGFPEGWQPGELRWGPCAAAGDECTSLEVPLDWDDPSGETISLRLGRSRASGERIGSLVTNPGGPGASGLEFLAYAPVSPEISSRFDLVSWDPRGVGESTSPSCGAGADDMLALDQDPDDAAEQRQLDRAAAAISQECAATDAELLPHLGTEDVARDLEAIRLALGGEPLNYLGFSYGTHIGQVYAELFPENIRTLVLDAVVDPALGFEEFLVEQATAFERSFDRNTQSCARAGVAVCGVEDLAGAYDTVKAAVEQHPLGTPSEPTGPSELVTGAVLTSYGADGWRSLGPALAAALDGDGSAVRSLAESYWDFGGYTSYAGVVCIDTPPPRGEAAYRAFAAAAAAAAPRFGASVANELLPCATWPVEPVGAPAGITAEGAPPILVIGNTGDAATPYENAVAVAERLASGVLLTADIEGHGAYGSNACITELVDAYLVRLEVPGADPHCT